MIIASRLPLPVGQRWQPQRRPWRTYARSRSGNLREYRGVGLSQVCLDDPQRGIYSGPIFILRELDWPTYCQAVEEETGQPVPARDRHTALRNHRFYEISVD